MLIGSTATADRDPTARGVAGLAALFVILALVAPGLAAQEDDLVPESLREGWGFADDIRDLGDSLDGGYELSERDVDCDGEPEVLLEWLALRGATGNRSYFLFDHTRSGYRYLGRADAIWAVVDYGSAGGCYLATYGKGGGGALTLRLTAVAGGALETLGALELIAGDAGPDDDNALLSALRTGGLTEERLRQLAAAASSRPITLDDVQPPPWVERSSIEEVVENVEGYGPQVFERLRPSEVTPAPASPWWSEVSARAARQWAGAVEEALTGGGVGTQHPVWLPAPGSGGLEIQASRVHAAVRLNLPMGRPPVGIALGRFEATTRWPADESARAVGITWAGVFATTRLGEVEGILRLFVGGDGDGESRRIFRLERLTNLDHDRELEVVIEEEAYAGRVLWLLDVSRGDEVEEIRLHADAWD